MLIKKIALLGDGCVGKTSLVVRFVKSIFDEQYISTFGAVTSMKEVKFEKNGKMLEAKLLIWDLQGQKMPNDSLLKAHLRNSDGAFLVGDLTRKDTFDNLSNYWAAKLETFGYNQIPVIILGNKYDLKEQIQISATYFSYLSEKLKQKINICGSFYTSAKTSENVEKAFITLALYMC
ncbi:MAG: Rab family GTPase [Candidatus Nanoarchaeia archaeon]